MSLRSRGLLADRNAGGNIVSRPNPTCFQRVLDVPVPAMGNLCDLRVVSLDGWQVDR